MQNGQLPSGAYIEVNTAGPLEQTLYLYAEAHDLYQNNYLEINIVVCGDEQISPKNSEI